MDLSCSVDLPTFSHIQVPGATNKKTANFEIRAVAALFSTKSSPQPRFTREIRPEYRSDEDPQTRRQAIHLFLLKFGIILFDKVSLLLPLDY